MAGTEQKFLGQKSERIDEINEQQIIPEHFIF